METKYPDKWQEKRRAKPVCFVSRNQKRPGRHFYCFLETKHAKNPGLFPMFPFSCVSTSTLTEAAESRFSVVHPGKNQQTKKISIIKNRGFFIPGKNGSKAIQVVSGVKRLSR